MVHGGENKAKKDQKSGELLASKEASKLTEILMWSNPMKRSELEERGLVYSEHICHGSRREKKVRRFSWS